MDGLQRKILLKWMITRCTSILGNLHMRGVWSKEATNMEDSGGHEWFKMSSNFPIFLQKKKAANPRIIISQKRIRGDSSVIFRVSLGCSAWGDGVLP